MVKVSRQRSAELRIEILDATAAELLRVGYDAMALTAIAQTCGFATSAIYNRFPTKEALIEALIVERIEPELGAQSDAEAIAFWSGSIDLPKLNIEQLGVLAELLLAARHTPSLHESVYGFLRRRANIALVERNKAAARGEVLDSQEPLAQVLMRASSWIGSYVLGLVSEPPKRYTKTVEELMRLTMTNLPTSTPFTAERPNKARVAPNAPPYENHEHDAIHEALVNSAAVVFAEKGYHAAAVADIARRARLTTGAIYNRFTGKAGLMNAVIVDKLSTGAQIVGFDVVQTLAASQAISDPAVYDLMVRLNDDSGLDNRGLRLAARDASRHEPEVAAVVRPLQDATLANMANFVRNAQGEGLVRSDIDAETAVWFLVANLVGAGLVCAAFPEVSLEVVTTFYTTAMEAMRTQPV
ncbi:MAG: TetR/AcrR family transcriptional regulator [Acidimicrobiia bacterium]|nr:TetR/AcrR family transcriptional regulator [Acidimicrobiia bacterium]